MAHGSLTFYKFLSMNEVNTTKNCESKGKKNDIVETWNEITTEEKKCRTSCFADILHAAHHYGKSIWNDIYMRAQKKTNEIR